MKTFLLILSNINKMKLNIRQSIISTVILLLLDLIWISLYMGKKYETQVLDIQGTPLKINYTMAILAYVLMIIGLNMFVLPNIRKEHALEDSLKYGFTFGIVLYGVYDFTTGAVISKWDKKVAVIDILWGGFVYFIASYFGSIL